MISKSEITSFQLVFILIQSQVGVGVISLPFEIFNEAKGDSWMSVLLTGVMIQIVIFGFWALMNRFPGHNLYGIVQILFGKWFGKILILLYCAYFIVLGSISLAKYAYILKVWMLPLTPKWVLVTFIMIVAVYAVKEDLQIMARFFLLASIVLFIFVGSAAYVLKDAHITYIIPVGHGGLKPVLNGIMPSLYSFQGFELLLFIYPFVQSTQKKVVKAATIANVFVVFFYTLIVLVSTTYFSPGELKLVPEPLLFLVKSFSFAIIERPDLIFTSIWIILVATTIMVSLYASSLGLSVIMKSEKRHVYIYISAGISLLLALNFNGEYQIDEVSNLFNPFITLFAFFLPILFLLFSLIFKKKEGV